MRFVAVHLKGVCVLFSNFAVKAHISQAYSKIDMKEE